jgi:phosphatidylinositol glycan class U
LLPSPATFFGRLISIILYTALDILSADCLYEIAASGVAVASSVYSSPRRDESWKPVSVAAVYLLNPFTLLTCLARPTTVFTTFFVLLSIRHATQGKPTTTAFALALASYTSLHPVLLLPPVGLLCYDQIRKGNTSPATKDGKAVQPSTTTTNTSKPLAFTLSLLAPFFATTALLLVLSRLILPSFTFLHSLYLTPLSLPDLTPNPGLWWYFFTEMFDAFRSFFLGVFWLHMLAYSVPFTVRLRAQPLAAVIAMLGVLAIFQPYANVGEAGAWLASTCLMGHVFSSKFLPSIINPTILQCKPQHPRHYILITKPVSSTHRYPFPALAALLYATLLGPAFHYLWLYAGSGNANFFYAITLVWNLALLILETDLVYAALRDEWEAERPGVRGKVARQI